MVETLRVDGRWWIPDQAQRRVGGQLRLSSSEFVLELDDALVAPEPLAPGEYEFDGSSSLDAPVIHGLTRDFEKVTLVDCHSPSLRLPFGDVQREHHYPTAALVGRHLAEGDLAFTKITMYQDYLRDWAPGPPIERDVTVDDTGRPTRVFAEATERTLETSTTPFGSASIRSSMTYDLNDHRAELAKDTVVSVEPVDALGWREVLRSIVSPLQDLVSFATTRAALVNAVYLRSHRDTVVDDSARLYVRLSQANEDVPTRRLLRHDMLFTLAELPGGWADGLEVWLTVRERFGAALTSMLVVDYSPFLYAENRFLNLAQAAEVTARELHGNAAAPKDVHSARVQRAVAAIASQDEELARWGELVLRESNYRRFGDLLDLLVVDAGTIGQKILDASPDFVRRVVKTRNSLTHATDDRATLGVVARHWHGDALRWLVRCALMRQVGFGEDAVERLLLRNQRFTFAINALKKSALDYAA